MSTYLVTGGAGFIGSFVCERLLADKNRVLCVDNFLTGRKENVVQLLSNKNFSLIKKDVCDLESYKRQVSKDKLDFILHLASPAGPNPKSPKSYHALPVETYLVNSYGTHLLLTLAKETGATMLFASTSEVYGDPTVHPQLESYFGNVNPIGPRAIYDESKRLGEAMCALWSRKFGVQTRIARIFNTYGPRMNPDDGRAVPLFIQAAVSNSSITIHGDGHQTRSFCYVTDQVNGLLALLHSHLNADPVNIGNPSEISIRDLASMIIRLSKSRSTIRFAPLPEDDPERRRPDIEKANRELKWVPEVALEKGLMTTIGFFRERKTDS